MQLNAFRKTPGASRPPGIDLLNQESEQESLSVNKKQATNTLASHIGRDGDFGYILIYNMYIHI